MNNALATMLEVFAVPKSHEGLYKGLLTSSVATGCFLGTIISVFLQHTSIRSAIIASDLLLLLGSGIMYFDSFYIFLGGRVLTGVGSGLATTFTTLYLKQISPTSYYSVMGAFYPIMYSYRLQNQIEQFHHPYASLRAVLSD